MKRLFAMAAASVLLAAGLPGLAAEKTAGKAADNTAGFPAKRCQDAPGCIPGESCREAKALYARAKRGDREAATALGLRLMMGNGVMPDETAAMHWFEKAAAKSDTAAQLALGAYLTRPDADEASVKAGLGWLEKAAKAGDWLASTQLGALFGEGKKGLAPDEKRAAQWRERARRQSEALQWQMMEQTVAPYRKIREARLAEQGKQLAPDEVRRAAGDGDPLAQTLAGVWLISGAMADAGMARDRKAGVAMLFKAAKAGDRLASAVLGALVLGEEALRDREASAAVGEAAAVRRWLKAAAEKGDGECMALYGLFLLQGIGGEADAKEGLSQLEKAAAGGVPEAMLSLAWIRIGQGKRNDAARWLGKVALVPDRPDMVSRLAWEYGSGEMPVMGESENLTEIRRYAERGDPLAMVYLAMIYDTGAPGRRFPCPALRWHEKAAEKGVTGEYLPLAMACAEAGDTACARKWLDAAVSSETAMHSEENLILAIGMGAYWLDRPGNGRPHEKAAKERARAAAKRLDWLHREGREGNAAAAAVLARLYTAGIGVEADEGQAQKWDRLGKWARARR